MNLLQINAKTSFIYRTVCHLTERAYFNDNLPERRNERTGGKDNVILKWPPSLPDLTLCDFLL